MIDVISPAYAALQRSLHAQPRGYGGRGDRWADAVRTLVEAHQCSSVLDYGCGQGSLKRAVMATPPDGLRFSEYDPAIDGKNGLPSFADLVVCTDVLEHIEPARLDVVLGHLQMLARKVVFAVVSLKASNKVLADGRNAHLIIQPVDWWLARVNAAGFSVVSAPNVTRQAKGHEWAVVLVPKVAS